MKLKLNAIQGFFATINKIEKKVKTVSFVACAASRLTTIIIITLYFTSHDTYYAHILRTYFMILPHKKFITLLRIERNIKKIKN